MPVAPLVTVAVKVTDPPYRLGLAELIRLVVVSALFTVWIRGLLVLLV